MSQAFIADELNARLLEHAPDPVLPSNRLDVSNAIISKKYPDAEFDCIIAPLILMSQKDRSEFFKEIHRILSPQGFFLFSTLGAELVHELEELGDDLLKIGFSLPVVDRENLQLQYNDKNVLLKDLELSGLSEKRVHVIMESETNIIATLDVMYGYALGASINSLSPGKIEIPIETIKIRKPT
ncbi:MAG: methyltransferase domain-containing protein [Pseudomonadota bacterium]